MITTNNYIFLILILFPFSNCSIYRLLFKNKTGIHLTVNVGSNVNCIKNLGCFSNGPPFFHPINRPTSFLPKDRIFIQTKFSLYTKKNIKYEQILKIEHPNTIRKSNFNPKWPTKIIVHGFMYNSFLTNWLQRVKDALLSIGNYNVILVDWALGSLISYRQSASNARVVGAEVALLIQILQDSMGVHPQSIHIIGHSQGAHVAGYAGKRIKYLGRITGLDAAGPYFRDVPPPVRLSIRDALFVDNIHTNAGHNFLQGIGTNEALGHVDFFPNGGNYNPSCKIFPERRNFRTLYELFLAIFFCNHFMSYEFFIASIKYPHCFVGVPCKSYSDFSTGKCICKDGNPCSVMGFHIDKYNHYWNNTPNVLYLKTGSRFPFCLSQYQIMLELGGNYGERLKHGKLILTIRDREDNLETTFLINKDIAFYPNVMYTFLMTSEKYLAPIKEVWLSWKNGKEAVFSISSEKTFLTIKYFRFTPLMANDKRWKNGVWCGSWPWFLPLNKSVFVWRLKCQS